MHLLLDTEAWIAFLTLTALELVLGIDNVIFISILVGRLPKRQRETGRIVGLAMAMAMRILLLLVVGWLAGLITPLFTLFRHGVSGRDLVLIIGGLFLVWKSTREIHESTEGGHHERPATRARGTFAGTIAQIIAIDVVFSLDSIITAVGMVDEKPIIVAAVIVSVGVMIAFAGALGRFVAAHPTVKMLALSFLCVIGVVLIADGFGHHVPKGYIYFSLAFAVLVELLNIRVRSSRSRRRRRRPSRAPSASSVPARPPAPPAP